MAMLQSSLLAIGIAVASCVLSSPLADAALPTDTTSPPELGITHRSSQDDPSYALLQAGWSAYERGDRIAALQSYRQALDIRMADASLWYDVGCLHALNGQLENAMDALRQAIAMTPVYPEA